MTAYADAVSADARSARRVGRVLLVPIWAGVLALVAVAVAHLVAFDRSRVFLLADSYTLWIYLPAYGIAVTAACFRSRTLTIVAGLLVVAQLAWVLPPVFRTDSIPAAARSAPRLRVLTANVNFLNHDHGPILGEITRDNADVVMMEEATPLWWLAIKASGLLKRYPYHVRVGRWDPGAMVLLSKLPLTDKFVHRADGWPIITATVVVGGQAVHLVEVHLRAPVDTFGANQSSEQAITRFIRDTPRPRLVAGDFNASPYNRWFGQIEGLGLREASEALGQSWTTTWPNGEHFLPPLRLDHVFTDPQLVPLDGSIGTGHGSDHRPLLVDLAVTG